MILFLCNTPVQVLRAIHMHNSMKAFEEGADLIIFSNFIGYDRLAARLRVEKCFGEVYVMERKDLDFGKFNFLKCFFGQNKLTELLEKKPYTKLVSYNIEGLPLMVAYNKLCRNRGFEYCCCEDGPGIYQFDRNKNLKTEFLYPALGFKNPAAHVDTWWFSAVQFMNGCNDAPKKQLPPIDRSDHRLTALINRVFEYEEDEEITKAEIMIMEESFYTDGLLTRDEDLRMFEKVRDWFPDKNILVKLHPRTRNNRFAGKFQVLEKNHIPWEVYVLNSRMTDKVFIAISCTTLISSKIMFGDENKVIITCPMFMGDIKDPKSGKDYFTKKSLEVYEQQRSLYECQEYYSVVNSEEELRAAIGNYLDCQRDE